MIIKYYGGYVDMETLRDMTNTNKNGVSAYDLIETSKKLNFESYGIRTSLIELKDLKLILPCIAHVTIDKTYQHYLVIYNINYHNQKITIADPKGQIRRLSFKEFESIWQGILLILFPIRTIPLSIKSTPYQEIIEPIIKNNKSYLITICLLSIILTIFGVAASFFVKYMIEAISAHQQGNMLLILLIFSIIYFIKIITDFYRNKIIIFLNQKIDLFLTTDTFKHIIHLPYRYYRNRTTGDIISRLTDLQAIRTVINKVAISLFVDLPLAMITLIFLYIISPALLLISIMILGLYLIIVFIFKRLFTNVIDSCQEEKAIVTSSMIESISAFETVKGINLEENIIKNNEKKYVSLLKHTYRFDTLYNYQYLLKELINTIGFLSIIYVGARMTLDGRLTLSNLILFDTLLTNFLSPIRNILDLDTNIKEASSALRRISNIKYKKKEQDGHISKKITGTITFKNLSYSYSNMVNVLKDINISIKSGDKVMIIGQSGSGKSTLLKFLMRYYEVPRETLFLDNVDINDYSQHSLKEGISYISQQETLFTDSLYNNIVLKRKITDEKFLETVNMCLVQPIIKNNNLGYNMLLEENGFNISGGEKQRVILARTLLKDFNILLIDEGLNQVDINLERKILRNLFTKYPDKTIIIISHRLENMDLFDRIIELNKGLIRRNDYKNG